MHGANAPLMKVRDRNIYKKQFERMVCLSVCVLCMCVWVCLSLHVCFHICSLVILSSSSDHGDGGSGEGEEGARWRGAEKGYLAAGQEFKTLSWRTPWMMLEADLDFRWWKLWQWLLLYVVLSSWLSLAGRGASPRGGGGRQAQESERGLAEGFQIHKAFKVIDFMQPSVNLQNSSHESRFFKIIDPQHIHPQEFAAEKAADKETKEEEEGDGEGVEQDTGDGGGGDEEEAKKDEGGQGEGGGQAQEDTSDPGDGSPAGEGEAGPGDDGPVQEEKEEEEEKTTEGQNQETEPSEAAADDDQPVEEQVDSGESWGDRKF